MKKVSLILPIFFFAVCGYSSLALAVPSLGVATDSGIYAYNTASEPTDAYLHYFATTFYPSLNGVEGFILGTSPSNLTVFTSYDPAVTQLYLLASNQGNNQPMSFGGVNFTLDDYSFVAGQADGYAARPYAYLQLPASGWVTHSFGTTFYLYTGQINYSGSWQAGDYFFSAAEINGVSGLQYAGTSGRKDDFSPKTTSAGGYYNQTYGGGPVPEPATLTMLGLGLLGVWRLKRKKA